MNGLYPNQPFFSSEINSSALTLDSSLLKLGDSAKLETDCCDQRLEEYAYVLEVFSPNGPMELFVNSLQPSLVFLYQK